MNPDDQTSKNPVNSAGTGAEPPRPTPWTPPQDDAGTPQEAENARAARQEPPTPSISSLQSPSAEDEVAQAGDTPEGNGSVMPETGSEVPGASFGAADGPAGPAVPENPASSPYATPGGDAPLPDNPYAPPPLAAAPGMGATAPSSPTPPQQQPGLPSQQPPFTPVDLQPSATGGKNKKLMMVVLLVVIVVVLAAAAYIASKVLKKQSAGLYPAAGVFSRAA